MASLSNTPRTVTKDSLRVGLLSNTYAPEKNGESVAVQALEKELRNKGVEVFLGVSQVQGVRYPSHILPLRAIKVPEWISPDLHLPYGYMEEAVEFFAEKQVDVIHTHNTLMGGMEGVYVAMRLGIPCIHTFHTYIEEYDYWSVLPGSQYTCKLIIKLVLNNCNHVIALSSKMHKYLFSQGVQTPIFRTHNVPLLDDIIRHNTPDTQLARQLGIDTTHDIIVFTHGRVAKEKGIEAGIEVMAEVIAANPNVKYLIAGAEVYKFKEEMQHKCAQLEIADNIIFAGRFSPETLGNLASLSTVYLNTSQTENHPTTLLEAMYLGLPGVYINDMAFDYIVKHNVNGFIGKQEDLSKYIQRLIADTKLYKRMQKAALASAQEYCSHDYTQDHIELYLKVIEQFQQDIQAENRYKTQEKARKWRLITNPMQALIALIKGKRDI